MTEGSSSQSGSHGSASAAGRPRPLTLTPDQEREGWVIKTQGGMQVKVLDLRQIETVRLTPKKG